jgi:hypothetical protein
MKRLDRRRWLQFGFALGTSAIVSNSLQAQSPDASNQEPAYRLSRADVAGRDPAHPLDPALRMAHETLHYIRENIVDYTGIVIKREQIDGRVGDHEFMGIKVRNRKVENGVIRTPFSVYTTFLKPSEMKGREAIYVENQNDGKVVAHEGGMKGRFIPTVELDPNGMIAMRGQRYPITELGIENLCVKLIERGERDRKSGDCVVEQKMGKLGDRPGLLITVLHPVQKPELDFHRAEIFIDEGLRVPVRYAAYDWPKKTGCECQVIEEYTYQNLKINVGLKDSDFDRTNPKYNF